VAEFFSPGRSVSCTLDSANAYCRSEKRQLNVTMGIDGQLRICRGSAAVPCLGFPARDSQTLDYGKQIVVGRFRCLSLRAGVKCAVTRFGKGFLISSTAVRNVGP
jgi:hypothetical protein